MNQHHPADELGKALARASGILTLLSGCYERSTGQFETGTSFVAESIAAVENILQHATAALARLYETCDLTVVAPEPIHQAEAPPVPMEEARRNSNGHGDALSGGSYLGYFGPAEEAPRLSERLDNILVNMPSRLSIQPSDVIDRPAHSYDELLQKVTALADVAAQSGTLAQNNELLPALQGLQADLLKLRTVA